LDDFTGNVGGLRRGLTPTDSGDARAAVTEIRSARDWLFDVVGFARRPTFMARPRLIDQTATLALLGVVALDLALTAFVRGLLALLDALTGSMPALAESNGSVAPALITGLLVAPFVEEALFRGWLTGRRAALRFAGFGFVALALFGAGLVLVPEHRMPLALTGVALVFVGLVQWGITGDRSAGVPAWFERHFHWLVWGSSLLFGLIHLGKYAPLESPLGVAVVLPQAIGGLLLAWTRIRLGLGAAIIHHAAYNAVLLALALAGR
jgi:membrane protease YdiL (CAAX protease family)